MNKQLIMAAAWTVSCITMMPAAKAQVWNGTSVPSVTNDNVGAGILTPDAKVHIVSGYDVFGSNSNGPCSYVGQAALKIKWNSPEMATICMNGYTNTVPNILEIFSQSSFSIPAGQIRPIMWLNSGGQLGLNTYPVGGNRLSVSGNSVLNGSLQVGNIGLPTGSRMVVDGDIAMLNANDTRWRSIIAKTTRGALHLAANTGSSDGPNIEMYGSGAPDRAGKIHFCSYGTTGGGMEFINYDPARSTWTSNVKITNEGQVIIGGTRPTGAFANFKLGVDGDIVAKRVVVEISNWADYVFAPSYQLRSLDEVKSFIDEHHHLPEVPAEKEVKENGLSVGEMNAILLKKVEELTLYVIQQEAKINELNKKVSQQ